MPGVFTWLSEGGGPRKWNGGGVVGGGVDSIWVGRDGGLLIATQGRGRSAQSPLSTATSKHWGTCRLGMTGAGSSVIAYRSVLILTNRSK